MHCGVSCLLRPYTATTNHGSIPGPTHPRQIDLETGGECKLKDGFLLTNDHTYILGRRYDLWTAPAVGLPHTPHVQKG